MVRRVRLDTELVRRGLVPSREQAVAAIGAGRVRVGGQVATKPATVVSATTSIALRAGDDPGYASRGAHKLLGALDTFGPDGLVVAGRRCLDAGASTGGFTDVLLRRGASEVVAVDVGYGQLDWRLRTDPRVRVLERTNVRYLTPAEVGDGVSLVVGDLSFISLRLVLPALRRCARPEADFVLLVKPQFEVGRERLGAGGVVRDPALHAEVVTDVAAAAAALGLGVRGVVASTLPGPAGNVEYLLWLAESGGPLDPAAVAAAVAAGPAGPAGAAGPAGQAGQAGQAASGTGTDAPGERAEEVRGES